MIVMPMARQLRAALEDTGLPWELEQRKKHICIRLAGQQIGVVSRSRKTGMRGVRNLIASIKRAAREYGQTI